MIIATGRVVLGSDEGVFVIQGGIGDPWNESTLLEVNEEGAYGEPGSDVWVLTGDQWGPFEVTAHVLDGPPGEAAQDWEDVSEVSLLCADGLLVAELVDQEPCIVLSTEAGTNRIRVSARARSTESQTGDEDEDAGELAEQRFPGDPVEHYLIEVWPAPVAPPADLRETSTFALAHRAGPRPEPVIEGAEAGLAGSANIGRDVDGSPGARPLTGATGVITVSRRIPGTRRSMFKWLKAPVAISQHVPSWSLSSGPDRDELGSASHGYAGEGHPDQLTGRRACLRGIVVEEVRPARWVRHWAWMVPPEGQETAFLEHRVPLFTPDSVITTTYTETKDDDGRPWTLIEVEHAALPVEWLDDMQKWWTYQLAYFEHLLTDTGKK